MKILIVSSNDNILAEQLSFFRTVLIESGVKLDVVRPGERVSSTSTNTVIIGRIAKNRATIRTLFRDDLICIYLSAADEDLINVAQQKGYKIADSSGDRDQVSLNIWAHLEKYFTNDKSQPMTTKTRPKKTATIVTPESLGEFESKYQDLLQSLASASVHDNTLPVACNTELSLFILGSTRPESFASHVNAPYKPDDVRFRLLRAEPRNELDASSKSFYEESEMGSTDAAQEYETLPYNTRAYLLDSLIGDAPEKLDMTYRIECIVKASDLTAIVRYGKDIALQPISPLLGFDMIDDSEDETYENCFDASAEAYSHIAAAGKIKEAQLACLNGHLIRCSFSVHPSMIKSLQAMPFSAALIRRIQEIHPRIGEYIRA